MATELRTTDELSTLDEMVAVDGTLEAFQATAIKEVIAWQLAQAMKDQKITPTALAKPMGSSRTRVGRLLDLPDGNMTITTLQRAAEMVFTSS